VDIGRKVWAAVLLESITRPLQAYLGHSNIQNTIRYTAVTRWRFWNFWRDKRRLRVQFAQQNLQNGQSIGPTHLLPASPRASWRLPSPTACRHSDKNADSQCYRDGNERTLFSFLRDLTQRRAPVSGGIFAKGRRLLAEQVCALAEAIRPP
jgi:hypothetical protein